MRVRLSRFVAVVAALVCLSITGLAQSEPGDKTLPKFHQVNAVLYRGAQPKQGGLRRLAELGVKTIVDLRSAGDRARAEEREARALGLRYYNVPLKWFGKPKDEQVERVLKIIAATENQPVFVHCAHGVDRTGLIVAVYRIAREGWTSAQAKAEAKRLGMHWWKFELKSYIRDYYKRRTRDTGNALTSVAIDGPVRNRRLGERLSALSVSNEFQQHKPDWPSAPSLRPHGKSFHLAKEDVYLPLDSVDVELQIRQTLDDCAEGDLGLKMRQMPG